MLKTSLESLSEKELDIFHNLDNQPYGEDLATLVAKKLVKGTRLFHAHRDYCGLGLHFFENVYVLGVVNDGNSPNPIVVSCDKEADFITWLAKENDQSMALYGELFNNQTITKIRLEWFLEEQYSPVWNEYCGYLREIN